VIREDDVRPAGDPHVGVEPAFAQVVDLGEQRFRVDDAAVAEDTGRPPDCAARH
jgi:hypothetical protein